MSVVLIFFLFFFGFRFGIRARKRNLLAVWRPSKTLHATLTFVRAVGSPPSAAHHVELLLVIAIRKESELLAVGRPAR